MRGLTFLVVRFPRYPPRDAVPVRVVVCCRGELAKQHSHDKHKEHKRQCSSRSQKMALAELIRLFGEDVADAIMAHKMSCKTLMNNEIRDHPDAPGCEAGIVVPFCSYSACKPRASTCYTCAMPRARLRDNTGSWIMKL